MEAVIVEIVVPVVDRFVEQSAAAPDSPARPPASRSSAFSAPFAALHAPGAARAAADPGDGTMSPPSTPSTAGVWRRGDALCWGGDDLVPPLPAASPADAGECAFRGASPPRSRLSPRWDAGAGGRASRCFEARRRLRNTASAMRATAPATAEATPATIGVEFEADPCSCAGVLVSEGGSVAAANGGAGEERPNEVGGRLDCIAKTKPKVVRW